MNIVKKSPLGRLVRSLHTVTVGHQHTLSWALCASRLLHKPRVPILRAFHINSQYL
jgi:hypothetical protein